MSTQENSFNGNWLYARRKITEGKNFTTTTPIPFGSETIDLHHRLLTETELFAVEASIDKQALMEHRTDGESEEERRMRELQEKDSDTLTEREERELEQCIEAVQMQKAGIMNSLGEETYNAFMQAGKKALTPSEDDVNDAFSLSPDEQERVFGKVLTTRQEAKQLLKSDMESMVEDQPYPIKYIIGQAAYGESMKLFGDEDEGNSMTS